MGHRGRIRANLSPIQFILCQPTTDQQTCTAFTGTNKRPLSLPFPSPSPSTIPPPPSTNHFYSTTPTTLSFSLSYRLFLAMLVCTNWTMSGRMGALITQGIDTESSPAAPVEWLYTVMAGLDAAIVQSLY